jgi:hypothetical protein
MDAIYNVPQHAPPPPAVSLLPPENQSVTAHHPNIIVDPTNSSPSCPAMTQNTHEAVGALMGLHSTSTVFPTMPQNQQQMHQVLHQQAPSQQSHSLPNPVSPAPGEYLPQNAKEVLDLLRETGMSLTDAERAEVQACTRSKNKKKYDDTQIALEDRIFKMLEDFGSKALEMLCKYVPMPNSNEHGRLFYRILAGHCDAKKKEILNECLILIAMKWKKLSPPAEKGNDYQPDSWCKYMQQLFIVFRKNGLLFDWKRDFNEKGEFHGQMKTRWAKLRAIDPTFGTMKNKAQFDIDIDRKFWLAIKEKRLKSFENPIDCTQSVGFVLGRYVAFRGAKEHHKAITPLSCS